MFENETFDYLNSLQRFGWKLGLDTISKLLSELGDPQASLKAVHVAGSNGKGTTVAMLEAIYREAGYRTGMYTSPHLLRVEERIQVNGQPIPAATLDRYVTRLRPLFDRTRCTFFEALTAMAFLLFSEQDVDIAFVEVGLGGRYDATNVIHPLLSIVTRIDVEHTEHLGASLEQIAGEKAGIIKSEVPCLTVSQDERVLHVLQAVCSDKAARFVPLTELVRMLGYVLREDSASIQVLVSDGRARTLELGLTGQPSLECAMCAIAATTLLADAGFAVPDTAISAGLAGVNWPGRRQLVMRHPKVVLDVAHNPGAIRQLVLDLIDIYAYDRLAVFVGLLGDKNYREIAQILGKAADLVFVVALDSARALPASTLAAELGKFNRSVEIIDRSVAGYAGVLDRLGDMDLLCVTGSHFAVGEFLNFHKNT